VRPGTRLRSRTGRATTRGRWAGHHRASIGASGVCAVASAEGGAQLSEPPASPGTGALRSPLALLLAAAGAPLGSAVWDEDGAQWRPTAATVGADVQIADVPLASSGSTQLALLVADSIPAAPPAAVGGAPLRGVSAAPAAADSAAVRAVTGTVRQASAPRADLAVESDRDVLVSITTASGQYVLPAAAGVTTTFTCRDRLHDLIGTADALPASAVPPPVVSGVDIDLASAPPRVVQIAPPNDASQVDRGATSTLTFSEPIVAASVSDASVRLLRVNGSATTPIAVRQHPCAPDRGNPLHRRQPHADMVRKPGQLRGVRDAPAGVQRQRPAAAPAYRTSRTCSSPTRPA